jgi:hypothetical protein
MVENGLVREDVFAGCDFRYRAKDAIIRLLKTAAEVSPYIRTANMNCEEQTGGTKNNGNERTLERLDRNVAVTAGSNLLAPILDRASKVMVGSLLVRASPSCRNCFPLLK